MEHGRHAGLRNQWGNTRAGSTPAIGTSAISSSGKSKGLLSPRLQVRGLYGAPMNNMWHDKTAKVIDCIMIGAALGIILSPIVHALLV